MNGFVKSLWALMAAGFVLSMAAWGAGCETDGVTPNCPADGGDCVTPPGDAFPFPDSGTD